MNSPATSAPTRQHRPGRAVILDVGGVDIAHRRVGRRGAAPVLVLHGVMGHHREWDVLAEALAADHDVVLVDQRGHGASARAAHYDLASFVSDAEGVVERLGLHRPVVVGHSLGGFVGLGLAARRPDLVERLVILDAGPESPATEFGRAIPDVVRTLGATTYASPDDAVDECLAADRLARADLMAQFVHHALVEQPDGRFGWAFDGEGLAELVATGLDADTLWGFVDRVTCPTLVVRGSSSEVLGADEARRLAERLAKGRLVEVPFAGHDLGVERPEAVADVVARFLATVRGGEEP